MDLRPTRAIWQTARVSSQTEQFPAPSGVIFDFDGTLARTEDAVVACARQTALDLLGKIEFSDKDVTSRMGLPLAHVFMEVSAKDLDFGNKMANHYRAIFDRYSDPIHLFSQAMDYVQALRERGYPVAIASSRGVDSLHKLVKKLGLSPYLQSIVGEEDPKRKKPFPDPAILAAEQAGFDVQKAWMVGDTTFDMEMGANAKCFCIGLTHGSHDRARLSDSPAHVVYDSFAPLMERLPATR